MREPLILVAIAVCTSLYWQRARNAATVQWADQSPENYVGSSRRAVSLAAAGAALVVATVATAGAASLAVGALGAASFATGAPSVLIGGVAAFGGECREVRVPARVCHLTSWDSCLTTHLHHH